MLSSRASDLATVLVQTRVLSSDRRIAGMALFGGFGISGLCVGLCFLGKIRSLCGTLMFLFQQSIKWAICVTYACLWNGPQKASTLFRAPMGRESTGTQQIQDPVYDACSFCGTGKYLCGVVVSIPFLYDESWPEGIVQDWSHCF